MEAHYILTVVGPDQPGIVHRLAGAVTDAGGSWQTSRMARLAGHFAGIVEVTGAADAEDALRDALDALSTLGVRVDVTPAAAPPVTPPRERVHISVVGLDRPGIARGVASAVADVGASVIELDSEVTLAPMSGDRMFAARFEVELPPELGADALRGALEGLAEDLMVDVELRGA